MVHTKPHQVRETPALNPNGGVAKNGHVLVVKCELYIVGLVHSLLGYYIGLLWLFISYNVLI